jgi:DNA-directed RNA polymerase specialized sigma24 family protein
MSELKTQVAGETTRQARLEELYLRNAPHALTTAYFLTGNRDLAEDLVQEAFVRVTGRFGHLRTPDAFPGYPRRTGSPQHAASRRSARGTPRGRRGRPDRDPVAVPLLREGQ